MSAATCTGLLPHKGSQDAGSAVQKNWTSRPNLVSAFSMGIFFIFCAAFHVAPHGAPLNTLMWDIVSLSAVTSISGAPKILP